MLSWYVVGSFDGVNKWSHSTGYAMTETETDVWVKENLHFKVGDEFKVCDEEDKNWQGGWSYNNGSSNPKTYFTAANDGANIVCAEEGDYNITFTKSDWHIKVEKYGVAPLPKYSVDVYVDGVKRGTEEIEQGALPVAPSAYGKGFGGWYDDAACSAGHEVTSITAATTVYGETYNLPEWMYTLDVSRVSTTFGSENTYLYAFDPSGNFNAAWPGVKMDGNTFIVPNNAKVIINNTLVQTVDIEQSFKANDTLRVLNDKNGENKYNAVWESDLDEPTAGDGYYIVSSETYWKFDSAVKMTSDADLETPIDGDGNIAVLEGYTAVANEEIKVRKFQNEADAWYSAAAHDVEFGEVLSTEGHEGNFKFTTAGTYNIYFKDNKFYVALPPVEVVYTFKVAGGEALTLIHNEGTEYKFQGVSVTAGQQITVYADGVLMDGMLPKAVRNNNMKNDSFNKVLLDNPSADIYVDVNAKTIWISGMSDNAGYHILKNGNTLVEMVHTDDYDGFTQYCSELLTFAQNDTIEFINATAADAVPTVFHITTINAGGLGENFEVEGGIIKCKVACQVAVYMKLKYEHDEIYFGAVEQYIADATAFAEGFNSAIGVVCKNDGSTVRNDLETAWAAQATAFAALTAEAKAAVKSDSATVQAILDCQAKYESVYRLRQLGSGWTLENFLDMDFSSSRPVGTQINVNNTVLLVVVISSVAIIASLGLTFYFLRKRKYSK